MSNTRGIEDKNTDRWDEILRCPSCAIESQVSLAQRTGEDRPTVKSEPLGFNVIETDYGPAFYCRNCNKQAQP